VALLGQSLTTRRHWYMLNNIILKCYLCGLLGQSIDLIFFRDTISFLDKSNVIKMKPYLCKKFSILCLFLLALVLPVSLLVGTRVYAQFVPIPLTPPTTPTTVPVFVTPLPSIPQISIIPVSPTPTTIPTVTPKPKPNKKPVITSGHLPSGKVNKNYQAYVTGYDKDLSDNLTMTITNLPQNISRGPCAQYTAEERNMIKCVVSGIPQKRGLYFVNVTLADNKGNSSNRKLPFLILPR